MPSFTTSRLPKPKSWDEFEDIVADIVKSIWKDEFAIRNGRNGQRQDGVDIYGKSKNFNGEYCGVQCKDTEVNIKEFIFAIGSDRDSKIQEEVRLIDIDRIRNGKFGIRILFWDDICLILSRDYYLMIKHFPQFIERPSSLESIRRKIMESKPDDWLFDDEKGIYTYKKDTNLTIRRHPSFESIEDFYEEWLDVFPDKRGYRAYRDIYYGNSFIETILIVAVDGYRCYIPFPHIKNMTITKYQYILGRVINRSSEHEDYYSGFDCYLQRAGIKILDI